jgi:hypothetical protein
MAVDRAFYFDRLYPLQDQELRRLGECLLLPGDG